MKSNKERYKLFCEKEKNIPIFSQPWWLDVVCGEENWEVCIIGEGKNILATMPYYLLKDEYGIKINKAKLTQNNGIYIKYPNNQKISSKLDFQEKIINEVCNHIESLNIYKYEQQYHYNFTNWLPFFWREYKEITRYTYIIENTENMELVRENYSSKIRNQIKSAKKILKVVEIDNTESFYTVNKMTFDRQDREIPYTYDLFRNLYLACKERECCKLLMAIDDKERIHSVAMIVWDEDSVYYLLNGTDPEVKKYQGNALLIDRSIEIASELGKKFDFEGSVIKNIEHSFRQYGGTPKPYFRIYKEFN